ncbi:cytochrome ubiquinol oxidase subunit I [candidate division KSB1 bacterium]
MFENFDPSLIDWSRAQFALTAYYHWLFVPITLGLSFIIAIMESIYVKTRNEEWKRITKFWMKLFGINFAIGVATGIIMEFEFGTNWSNYSWLVGDIFGAPLAIEGIMAFFLESTFIALMFFGWNKLSKKTHLMSTWMVAFGSNLSALWILIANAWMQDPVGMHFNPDTARSEMINFWDVALSATAVDKFLHTISQAYIIGSLFVLCISSWFILKKREILFAKRSIVVASVFGFLSSIFVIWTGDSSAYNVAQKQPAKLAAMESIYDGGSPAGLIAFGLYNVNKKVGDDNDPFIVKIEIPYLLSILGYRNTTSYVPGINDLVNGNETHGILSAEEKMIRGKIAINALADYKDAKTSNDSVRAIKARILFDENFAYFGYGYLNNPESIIPNVPLTFYSFRLMVILGIHFVILFGLFFFLSLRNRVGKSKYYLWIAIISFPLGFIASMAGWLVAELGRQPWAIQDLLPTMMATSNIDSSAVILTFWIFAALFTALLIAEIRIMLTAIKKGPKDGGQ